jgi:cysteinyl-tRNA synthetase
MALNIYNTLTRRKEEFTPLHQGYVGLYVCGPTVYGHSHLGHAKSYVSFDVIVRYLRWRGYKVLYVQNITDVGHLLGDTFEGEDRILKQSRLEQKHPMQIAEEYTRSYFEDMDALNVLRPDISPRASGHVTEQIEMILLLLERGFAYEVNGSVYFDVRKFSGYGKLSGRNVEELEAGTRVETKSEKRNPEDFALWKKAGPDHLMRWPSPWGVGFPGWHIECSAMSTKYLGATFDIHGGGLENQFPHHECEIAQSEGASEQPFARYWVHNNMVTVNGQKMGKSLGNFVTLKEAFTKWDPAAIRFFILQSHYRSTLDFSNEALEAASAGLSRLRNVYRNLKEYAPKSTGDGSVIDAAGFTSSFLEAMDDDFNAPGALSVLFDLSREVNACLGDGKGMTANQAADILRLYQHLAGDVLGLSLEEDVKGLALDEALMELILDLRKDLRSQKLFSLADKIREALTGIGITLEDKKEGTSWKRIGTPGGPR